MIQHTGTSQYTRNRKHECSNAIGSKKNKKGFSSILDEA